MTFIDEKQMALTTRRSRSWYLNKAITTNKDNKQSIETKVKNGGRILENILLRRIVVKYCGKEGEVNPRTRNLSGLIISCGKHFDTGHYWIEIINPDEDKYDPIRTRQIERKSTAKEERIHLYNVSYPNGFRESYGWYPDDGSFNADNIVKKDARIISGKGFLNGDCILRKTKDENLDLLPTTNRNAGRSRRFNSLSSFAFDPHQNGRFHPDIIDFTTNPYLLPGDSRTDNEIIKEIRKFAENFHTRWSEEWSWNNDGYDETNCHTFLFLLLAKCKLADPDCIGRSRDPHFIAYKKSLESKKGLSPKYEERKKLVSDLHYISQPYRLEL